MLALEAVSKVAPLEKPVLVVGERGTGKELIAARLHYLSNRWDGEFLKLNCAAISDALIESELFGHEAGSFTGATRTHQGRFERADGGTLFLDELATTSALVQEKLLRVIEYGEFERVGGRKSLHVNVRLIAATNEDLPRLAAAGHFRMDLLDRLAFDVITLPPLRGRADDIPILAEYFAINMASELERDYFPGFSHAAESALLNHRWPGNLRELKNVVERAVYRTPEGEPVKDIVIDPFESPFRPAADDTPARPHKRLRVAVGPQKDHSGRGNRPCEEGDGQQSIQPAQSRHRSWAYLRSVPRLPEEIRLADAVREAPARLGASSSGDANRGGPQAVRCLRILPSASEMQPKCKHPTLSRDL